MKTLKFYALVGAIAVGTMLTSCSKDEDLKPAYTPQDGNEQLSTQEYTGLIDLYEQQKLHIDVYTAMYKKTGSDLFYKLMQEEEIVLDLLAEKFDAYDERNPLKLKAPGEYFSSESIRMYSQFNLVKDVGILQVLQFAVNMEESTVFDVEAYIQVLYKEDILLVCSEMVNNSKAQIGILTKELKSRDLVIEPFNPVADF